MRRPNVYQRSAPRAARGGYMESSDDYGQAAQPAFVSISAKLADGSARIERYHWLCLATEHISCSMARTG